MRSHERGRHRHTYEVTGYAIEGNQTSEVYTNEGTQVRSLERLHTNEGAIMRSRELGRANEVTRTRSHVHRHTYEVTGYANEGNQTSEV